MRIAATCLFVLLLPSYLPAQEPIPDMHLHAMAADAQGPPPLAICAPFEEFVWEFVFDVELQDCDLRCDRH